MHRIIKAHLESFVESWGLGQHGESTQFEMFVNHAVLASKICGDFDLDDVTTGEADDGTDGIAILIDEELFISDEDATSIFSKDRKNHDVEVVFVQAKRSESFDLGNFLKFKESILRFVNSDHYRVDDDVQNNAHSVFDISIKNVPKIRDGKPFLTARFVTTGIYRDPDAFEKAKADFIKQLEELGYFSNIDIEFIGRDELTTLWVSTYSGVSAELPMFSNAALPLINGIDEAYLVIIKAKDFVHNLLVSEDGNLRSYIFEENVRAFLGADNPVNKSITETLSNADSATRFPVLNNGITVVSPDVRVQGSNLHIENFQIVNGCQTSNMLYQNKDRLDDTIMVSLKVVETQNEDVFSDLVRATNSQTKVEETQFLSLRPIVKRIEAYFNTYEGQDGRLYFERRDRQYVGRDIPVIRTFSVNIAAKCVASMFLKRPDLAYRYPKRMYELLSEEIFSDNTKEVVFYASCLSLYRLHLLVASADIPQNMRKFKWHILVLVGAIVAGKEIPKLNSRSMESYCQKIIGAFAKSGSSVVNPFRQAVEIISSIDDITDGRLKRQLVMEEMLNKIS
ncbi:MAG: AIPR family protein [Deltaproteobacteria bacterium]|nr:AIPR family protein [Deltaproteobacteria bacterium]